MTSRKEWKIKNTELVHSTPYIEVWQDTVEVATHSGQFSRVVVTDGVIIVPVKISEGNRDNPTYILVEQYRHAVDQRTLEFPRGGIAKREDFTTAAQRELQEETGYTATAIKLLGFINPMNSFSSLKTGVFLATLQNTPTDVQHDTWESLSGLRVIEMSGDELLKSVQNGDITDASTLAALTVVMLNGGVSSLL